MKLSIIILRLPSNHGANIRTNQGSLRRCHCTVNLLASVTMIEGGCTPSLSNLRLTLKIQSIYYIECHMTYKYVYVFYCASINVVEIFRASYDVSDFTIGGNCPKETFGTNTVQTCGSAVRLPNTKRSLGGGTPQKYDCGFRGEKFQNLPTENYRPLRTRTTFESISILSDRTQGLKILNFFYI